MNPPPTEVIARVFDMLNRSQFVLIGAGAGMSVDAGFDYTSEAQFVRRYPVMAARGPRCRYDMFGFDWPNEAVKWGHLARHLEEIRFGMIPNREPYDQLRALTDSKDRFVITSNADDLFDRTGFSADRIFTPQGSYRRLQCLSACQPTSTWLCEGWVREAVKKIDLATEELTDPKLHPKCPNCGGDAMMNVRGGDWFVETPYRDQADRLAQWLARAQAGKLLVLDVGTGFNTPGVIRWPGEQIAFEHPGAFFVRINVDHPEVPVELQSRAIALRATGSEVWSALTELRRP
jgi:NAD-dependent SIR2 family protein deacetylase